MSITSLPSRAMQAYSSWLKKAPYKTQAATTGGLWALGDIIAQKLQGKQLLSKDKPIDARSTLVQGAYGFCVLGPVGHWWYQTLDVWAARLFTSRSPRFVAAKLAADTLILGPLHILAYYTWTTSAAGGTVQEAWQLAKKDFVFMMSAEMAFWPLFQPLLARTPLPKLQVAYWNFSKMPVKYHLFNVNCASVAESSFFSLVRSQDTDVWDVLRHKVRSLTVVQGDDNSAQGSQ